MMNLFFKGNRFYKDQQGAQAIMNCLSRFRSPQFSIAVIPLNACAILLIHQVQKITYSSFLFSFFLFCMSAWNDLAAWLGVGGCKLQLVRAQICFTERPLGILGLNLLLLHDKKTSECYKICCSFCIYLYV